MTTKRIAELEVEVSRLETALTQYASSINWADGDAEGVRRFWARRDDGRSLARAALRWSITDDGSAQAAGSVRSAEDETPEEKELFVAMEEEHQARRAPFYFLPGDEDLKQQLAVFAEVRDTVWLEAIPVEDEPCECQRDDDPDVEPEPNGCGECGFAKVMPKGQARRAARASSEPGTE